MTADPRVYLSDRMAHAYGFNRPALHAPIWARIVASLRLDPKPGPALDVGCGAGASTLALCLHAGPVVGLDPSPAMLRQARLAVPEARFVLGKVESLPFAADAFAIVAAAGSLNYSDPRAAVREVARVLRPSGSFVAYDFSTGRAGGATAASAVFKAFRQEFPPLPGYALDLATLPCDEYALEPVAHQKFELHATMSAAEYVEYLLGETNVDAVIAAGTPKAEARAICRSLFEPSFGRGECPVRFSVEFAIARKRGRG